MKKEIEVGSGEFLKLFSSADRFQKLEDGWVKDTLLGIDWGPSSNKTMNFEAAKKYCADLGGRLPKRFELITLIDETKRQPAINPIFTDTKTDDYYWSGTDAAGNEGNAWIVSFYYGYVSYGYKHNSNYVRPCRVSQ